MPYSKKNQLRVDIPKLSDYPDGSTDWAGWTASSQALVEAFLMNYCGWEVEISVKKLRKLPRDKVVSSK